MLDPLGFENTFAILVRSADAERLGIRYVWFPGEAHEVKDIVDGIQSAADLEVWTPAVLD